MLYSFGNSHSFFFALLFFFSFYVLGYSSKTLQIISLGGVPLMDNFGGKYDGSLGA